MNRLAPAPSPGIVAQYRGNKDSEDRIADYCKACGEVWLQLYITINISSPNTPGLRALQTRAALEDLLGQVMVLAEAQTRAHGRRPVFLKVAPDLDEDEVRAIAETVVAQKIDALIVSNTTVDRPDHLQAKHKGEQGGLSGRPEFEKSTRLLREFKGALGDAMPLDRRRRRRSAADATSPSLKPALMLSALYRSGL